MTTRVTVTNNGPDVVEVSIHYHKRNQYGAITKLEVEESKDFYVHSEQCLIVKEVE